MFFLQDEGTGRLEWGAQKPPELRKLGVMMENFTGDFQQQPDDLANGAVRRITG
jgi:hypothetical protein